LATFLSELATNVVLINTMLPVLAAVAVSLRIDPRLLLIPATIAASCGFMLPIATPPNAIVFSTGRIPMRSMTRIGLILNLLGVLLITLTALTLLLPVFDISVTEPPDWLPADGAGP
jgi:sodium-dependent dicarboxylate transporter 2/3/5